MTDFTDKELVDDYHEGLLAEEGTELGIYAYDAVSMILDGLKTGDVNHYLHTVKDFKGQSGTFSADGENGYTFEVATKVFTKDGYQYLDFS